MSLAEAGYNQRQTAMGGNRACVVAPLGERLSRRSFHVTLRTMTPRTGAERYFAERMEDPAYRAAHDVAAQRIRHTDELVRGLDHRRVECGLSKSELARRAGMPPETVRRLFTVDHVNPTAGTVVALAEALNLDLVMVPRASS